MSPVLMLTLLSLGRTTPAKDGLCDMLQVLEAPSISGNQADADRATDALFGNVLQGPPTLTPPSQPSTSTGTGTLPCCALAAVELARESKDNSDAAWTANFANLRPQGDVCVVAGWQLESLSLVVIVATVLDSPVFRASP